MEAILGTSVRHSRQRRARLPSWSDGGSSNRGLKVRLKARAPLQCQGSPRQSLNLSGGPYSTASDVTGLSGLEVGRKGGLSTLSPTLSGC